MRSSPPACRSKLGPSSSMDITEHSMCQPGRPRPMGVSHEASPGLGAFQRAKSRALSFSYSSTSTRAPSSMPAKSFFDSLPYSGNFQKRPLVFRRVLLDGHPIARGVVYYLVIYVGDVHHVANVVSTLLEEAIKQVHRNKRPEVSDVAIVVDRRPTGVHAHLFVLQRLELFDFCGECVVKVQCHG